MRKAAVILAGAILSGGLAAGAEGRSSRRVLLGPHQTAVLSGAHVRCGSGRVNGLTYVDCGVANTSGEPKRGGYVALMAQDGRVNVVAVTIRKTVFSRRPASLDRRRAVMPIHAGDVIKIPGTAISCIASRVDGQPTIICYYLDRKGVVRPRSYSFGISDKVVTALGWDAARHVHLIHSWPENG